MSEYSQTCLRNPLPGVVAELNASRQRAGTGLAIGEVQVDAATVVIAPAD